MRYATHFHSSSYQGLEPGKRLIVLGAVHGNETCGTQAIHRVMAALDEGSLVIQSGSVTFVPVANPLAYALRHRMGQRNLNRNLYPTESPQEFEDHVANWLCPLLAQHEVLLDLHSFHTAGQPFALVGPENNNGLLEPFSHAADEEALAVRLGIGRIVDGWLSTYAKGIERRQHMDLQTAGHIAADPRYGVGTTEYMRTVGGWGITLECGQHDDPEAPAVAYQAILNTLSHLGMITGDIEASPVEALRLYEVIDKNDEHDAFSRNWSSFDKLAPETLIGVRANGEEIKAEKENYIVFPNPEAKAGSEWFYLAEPCSRFKA